MKIDKKFIARSRLRYSQGSAMVGIVISVSTLLILAKSFESFFRQLGIPIELVYVILPIAYIALCWYVGMLYDTWGFWGEETSHCNEFLNPEFNKMIDDVGEIKKMLEEKDNEKREKRENS